MKKYVQKVQEFHKQQNKFSLAARWLEMLLFASKGNLSAVLPPPAVSNLHPILSLISSSSS
jgi:hypothetical protein